MGASCTGNTRVRRCDLQIAEFQAEFGLDNLWRRASGRAQEALSGSSANLSGVDRGQVPVPLFKKGEQTGLLNISIALQGAGYSVAGPAFSTKVSRCFGGEKLVGGAWRQGNQMNLEPSPAHAQGEIA